MVGRLPLDCLMYDEGGLARGACLKLPTYGLRGSNCNSRRNLLALLLPSSAECMLAVVAVPEAAEDTTSASATADVESQLESGGVTGLLEGSCVALGLGGTLVFSFLALVAGVVGTLSCMKEPPLEEGTRFKV